MAKRLFVKGAAHVLKRGPLPGKSRARLGHLRLTVQCMDHKTMPVDPAHSVHLPETGERKFKAPKLHPIRQLTAHRVVLSATRLQETWT